MNTETEKEYADRAVRSDAVLDVKLEQQLRNAVNPLYEDVMGTESYERKRLLGEIDRLRTLLNKTLGRAI